LARDVLESVNNIFKLVAEIALRAKFAAASGSKFARRKLGSYAAEFGAHADKSLRKSSGELGDKIGPGVLRLAKRSFRLATGGFALYKGEPILAAWLIQHFPDKFAWLESVQTFLHLS
jgi:hypothetical protein